MSFRLQMVQVARLAPRILGDSAELCRKFLLSQVNQDGGFKDRVGKSDLYYTVFGLDGFTALRPDDASSGNRPESLSNSQAFVNSFGDGDGLDFVHLCCLARCRGAVAGSTAIRNSLGTAICERVGAYRSVDGGFNPVRGSAHGTAYGAFLAAGAYQDCGVPLPEPLRLVQSLKFLETADGAWTNERHSIGGNPSGAPGIIAQGSTTATAAAVIFLRDLGMPVNPAVADWLLARAHPQGGFCATPVTPVPDLLSTATSLHALAALEVPFADLKEKGLDFVDSLWTNDGGFYGHWGDDHLDCEYLFYGLLALGHLSL